MTLRLNYRELSKEQFSKLLEFTETSHKNSIEPKMRDLINILVSRLNGCAFCFDMHTKEAKIHGERELRLYHLAIWRDSPLFSAKEKVAFEWAEALTKIKGGDVDEAFFNDLKKYWSEQEVSDLTFVVAIINTWNRFGVGFASEAGSLDKMFGLDKAGLE